MNLFLLYLWTKIDEIHNLIIVIICITGMGLLCAITISIDAHNNKIRKSETDIGQYDKTIKLQSRIKKWLIPIFVVSIMFKILVPSKEDAAIVAAAYAVQEISANETTKRIASAIETIILKSLEEKK